MKRGLVQCHQHGEGGVGAAAAWVGPGAQHDGGHDRAHASPAEQLGPPGSHQGGDGPGVLDDLGLQELDAVGQGAQAGRGGGGLGIPGGLQAQRLQAVTSWRVSNP
jgi:hypothetical protein